MGSITSPAATLTVPNATLKSIAVTPADPAIVFSTQQPFTATGTFSDGSTLDIPLERDLVIVRCNQDFDHPNWTCDRGGNNRGRPIGYDYGDKEQRDRKHFRHSYPAFCRVDRDYPRHNEARTKHKQTLHCDRDSGQWGHAQCDQLVELVILGRHHCNRRVAYRCGAGGGR